eukprot:COSAG04_NODE_3078_length_3191_cov_2.521992_2_plen_229_part_00
MYNRPPCRVHELGFSRITPARHHCPAYPAAALAAHRQEVHHLPSCPAASPCQEVLLPSSPEALPQQATICQQMPWSCRRELGLTSASHHPWRHTARWPAHPRGHCEQHPGVSNIEAARDNECAAAQTHFLPPSFPEALQCNTQSGCESECAAIGRLTSSPHHSWRHSSHPRRSAHSRRHCAQKIKSVSGQQSGVWKFFRRTSSSHHSRRHPSHPWRSAHTRRLRNAIG